MTAALSRLSLDGVTRPIQVNAIPHDDLESPGTEREGRKERMKDKKRTKRKKKDTRERERRRSNSSRCSRFPWPW